MLSNPPVKLHSPNALACKIPPKAIYICGDGIIATCNVKAGSHTDADTATYIWVKECAPSK